MQVRITHQPSYAKATVSLAPGESVKAEAGAMMGMSADMTLQTATGGLMKGLKRSLMGGESFFQNTYTAGPRGGTLELVPALSGDLYHTHLDGGRGLIVQDSSYLASAPSITVDTKWQGLRGFMAGEGFVMLHVTGTGDLVLSSYGAIDQRTLGPGETWTVDSGHIVAFTDTMQYGSRRIGGLKSTLFSGEGIVTDFVGPGTLWTQSRSIQGFLGWLQTKLPGGGGRSGGEGGGILGQFLNG